MKTDYTISVLKPDEFRKNYQKFYNHKDIDLKDKIKYFDYYDMSIPFSASKSYEETMRLITIYNSNDIIGVCKIAYWEGSQNFAVSYLSVNTDYQNQGFSRILINKLFEYFAKTYPNETLHMSGYSVKGWKYLRKYIVISSEIHNVTISEKAIEYITEWSDESRKLFDESRLIINNQYKLSYYIYS